MRLPVLFSTALAGVLVTLSLAPLGWWPLAVAASALLYFNLHNKNPAGTFLLGFVFSLSLFLSGASWVYVSIHEFGYTSAPFAAFLTFLFCISLALINGAIWLIYSLGNSSKTHNGKKRRPLYSALAFACTGLLSETLRSWLFTGFPWLYLGYSQTEAPLAGWAPLVGVYGISFLLYYSGAMLGNWALLRRGSAHSQLLESSDYRITSTAVVVMLWIAGPFLHNIDWTSVGERAHGVSLVQANISQHEKWRPDNLLPTLRLYSEMSKPYWPDSDILLWPEAAIPREYHAASTYIQQMAAVARHHDTTLITGIPYRDPQNSEAIYNSIIATGDGEGVYHKQRLVPFGEYIPLQTLFGKLMAFFELPLSSMSSGGNEQQPLAIGEHQSLPLICYEIVYPALAAAATQYSDVLITVSNDSWFGASLGPKQHLQMAQMRALENGRFLLRGTGNGISAIIDQRGEIVRQSAQFSREVLSGTFHYASGYTPWSRWGYLLVPWLNGLILAAIVALKYRGRNSI